MRARSSRSFVAVLGVLVGERRRRAVSAAVCRGSLAWLPLVMTVAIGCGRRIEEEPPIPDYRIESCETWCRMIFDPVCPQEVEVESEEQCVDNCSVKEATWVPLGDGRDACAATKIAYTDCMAALSCEDRNRHFELVNVVPPEQRSSCGSLLQAQLDCQTEHD